MKHVYTVVILQDDFVPFMEDIAAALEKGGEETSSFMPIPEGLLRSWHRVKMSLKLEGERIHVELSLKEAPHKGGSGEQQGEEPSVPYRTIKQRLKQALKAISMQVNRGNLPDVAALAAFWEDCQTITKFHGYGDPHYPEFLAVGKYFVDACAQGDAKESARALQLLMEQVQRCHTSYK